MRHTLMLAIVVAAWSAGSVVSAAHVSAEDLARRTIERRAVEAVIWGMPAVNFDLMYQAMVRETAVEDLGDHDGSLSPG